MFGPPVRMVGTIRLHKPKVVKAQPRRCQMTAFDPLRTFAPDFCNVQAIEKAGAGRRGGILDFRNAPHGQWPLEKCGTIAGGRTETGPVDRPFASLILEGLDGAADIWKDGSFTAEELRFYFQRNRRDSLAEQRPIHCASAAQVASVIANADAAA
jgi:hypothetical protein